MCYIRSMARSSKEKNREYQAKWYAANRLLQQERTYARKKRLQEWLKNRKASLFCSDCGESHPATLDFHHVNPEEKEINIGKVTTVGWSIGRIEKEIEKCVVLCSNCHRKHHSDQ